MRQRENELVARATRIMLERTARTVGAEFFRALARGLAETLGTRLGFVGELVDPATQIIQTLALWNGDGYAANFAYSLIGTPCAGVIGGEFCHYPKKVAERFPDDKMLIDMGIESYVGLPIIGGQGRAIGLLAALHDAETVPAPELTSVLALFADRAAAELERVRFEAELARSEARYRQIVSSCIEGVWVIDAGAATTFVNRQMATMLGYSEAEMLGRPLSAFMDAAGKAVADAQLAQRASGVAELHEFRFLHKQGHDVWALVAANPLFDEAGAYAGALALATDVTDRRRLDAAAQQTQRLESL
ncbi:MAG TPA: PAS domain S-box protein, partial [Labilithrix sp.]|nr:PAS domain S-box protein [Labilithrix sp.]